MTGVKSKLGGKRHLILNFVFPRRSLSSIYHVINMGVSAGEVKFRRQAWRFNMEFVLGAAIVVISVKLPTIIYL